MTIHIKSVYGQVMKQVSLSQVFEGSVETVFDAWTDEHQLQQWWGPHGFTNPVCKMELRPGGSLLIHMEAPDGMVFPMHGMFHQIEKPVKLVFTSSAFEDEDGEDQLENLNTVLFEPLNGKTRVSLDALVVKASLEADEALEGMEEGWKQSFEKLKEHLKRQTK